MSLFCEGCGSYQCMCGDECSGCAAKDARIASLESALGVAREYLLSSCHCGYRDDEESCNACQGIEALTQPALAQAAEKWKRMESVIEAARRVDETPMEIVWNDCSEEFGVAMTHLHMALAALDACEKEGGKRDG